jgi:hypothetical protein
MADLPPCYGPVFANIEFSAQALEEKGLADAGPGKKRRIASCFLAETGGNRGRLRLGAAHLNFRR